MSLAAALVWEVRATGSDNSGGAFNPVTGASSLDYSQQDVAQQAYTDLVIGNPTTTQLSSVTRAFQATDVGNTIRITGGVNFTVGTYEIVSVLSGVATVDRSVGTAGATGGTGNLGGALALPATAFSRGVGGNTFYLKGAFTTASTITGPPAGTIAQPTRVIGYQVTRTDDLVATITSTNAAASPVLSLASGFAEVRNVKIDAAALSNIGLQVGAAAVVLHGCQVFNFLQRGFNHTTGPNMVFDCLASGGVGGSGSAGDRRAGFVAVAAQPIWYARCVSRAGATNGFASGTSIAAYTDCFVDALTQESAAGGHGFQIQGGGNGVLVYHATINNIQGSGLWANVANCLDVSAVQDTLFANVSRYAFESIAPAPVITSLAYTRRFKSNAFFNVALGRQLNVAVGESEITLTASPFNSATDLGINAAVGGGALLRQAGVPGPFLGLDGTTGFSDIGATQASASSGGGSSASAAISLWRELTNERNVVRVPDSTVVLYIQAGLEALNRRIEYHYTDDSSTVVIVAGTQEYPLPLDFLELVWAEHAGRELKKSSIERWRSETQDAWRREAGTEPAQYAVYANKIILRPVPNAAAVAAGATLTIRYRSTPPDFGSFGFDQLLSQDFRLPVYWAVAEWSAAYPDSAQAVQRRDFYRALFDSEAQAVAKQYADRGTQR